MKLTPIIWLFAIVLTWSGIVYDYYDRHHSAWTQLIALTKVEGQKYLNEEVEIDGKEFSDCTFENVTLLYHGRGATSFENNVFSKSVHIKTDDRAADVYFEAALGLGLAKGNTFYVPEGQTLKLPRRQTSTLTVILLFSLRLAFFLSLKLAV